MDPTQQTTQNNENPKKDNSGLRDLYDEKTNDLPISPNLQEKMNMPPQDPDELNITDQEYLHIVMKMIDGGKINLLNPQSLLNLEVYDKLTPNQLVRIDMDTQVLMARLRDIHTLWKLDQTLTYQMKNLIESLRQVESRVESECGDVYVI